jgi:hypothetical protein
MSQTLQLRIHSVRCIDETNGQWAERFGNDEIWLGGYSINAMGDTRVIEPYLVNAHFDDNEVHDFVPPRVFHSLSFTTAPGQWKEFGVGLVLVEKDNGGMHEAIVALAGLVQTQLKAQLAAAAASANPGVPAHERLKWAATKMLPAVGEIIKGRIIAAYSDDIFQPQHVLQAVRSPNFSFGGSPSSARQALLFREHGGVYEVVVDWHVPGAGLVMR